MKQYTTVIASYTFIESLRNKLIATIAIFILISAGAAIFAGSMAIIEADIFQISVLAFFLRTGAAILLSLMIITSINREFNDKNHEMILSTSITRTSFFIGKLGGYIMLALLFSCCASITMFIFNPVATSMLWGLALFCETVIIASTALLFAVIINNSTLSIFAAICFYMLSRSISTIVEIAAHSAEKNDSLFNMFTGYFMKFIYLLLPNLDSFCQTEWLLGGNVEKQDIGSFAIQTVIYSALLLTVALFDFNRKNI